MMIIRDLAEVLFGCAFGISISYIIFKSKMKDISHMSDKHLEMFLLMNKWLENERNGKKISDYLRKNGFCNAIIYGAGYVGKNLCEQLMEEEFEVRCFIDKNKDLSVYGKEVKGIDDIIDVPDVVIVSAIYYFEELEEELKIKFKRPVISFADIVYKM